MPHTTFSQKDWENYARCYDGLNELRPYRTLLAEVKKRLQVKEGERILEAACGTGNLTKILCTSISKNRRNMPDIYAVDYSTEMLSRAKEKCATHAQFVCADLNEPLPYECGYFNAIVSVNTLYALREPEMVLKEFARLLTPEGRLVLVTPKEGYQNGLILKMHSRSKKPDTYWENIHTSAEREITLIKEACKDSIATDSLITIAACNREINANRTFYFFTEKALRAMAHRAGFSVDYHGETYARQCHFMVLKKLSLGA